jgi:hypothetical protein
MDRIKARLEEMQPYLNANKEKIFAERVQERLDKSLKTYYDELNALFESCEQYANKANLLKRLNKG